MENRFNLLPIAVTVGVFIWILALIFYGAGA